VLPVGAGQPERPGQEPHRGWPWRAAQSGFDLADATDVQLGVGSEFFLRQAQPSTVGPDELAEHASPLAMHRLRSIDQ
jgi:hypothetical protein